MLLCAARSLALLGSLTLLAAPAAAPDKDRPASPPDKPTAPPTTPDMPPPSEEGILLAFKHRTGQVHSYKSSVKLEGAVTPQGTGQASNIGSIPFTIQSNLGYSERVAGTRKGAGTLALTVNSLAITRDMPLAKVVLRYQNGKATMSVNGKPIKPSTEAEGAAAEAAIRKPSNLRRETTGKTTPIGNSQSILGQVFGSSSFTIVQFSGMPVKVGDSWETTDRIHPAPLGGKIPVVIPEIEFKYTHTFKGIQEKNGVKTALIETTGSGSAVGGPMDNTLSQSVMGTTRFDIKDGSVVSSAYNVILSLDLALPGGATGAANVNGLRLDGNWDVIVRGTGAKAASKAKKK